MIQVFSLALLLMLIPTGQNLPDGFYQLPEQLREKATVIVSGTYGEGRSPCIFMPDGSRRWALQSWFNVKTVYRGKVGGKTIYVNGRVFRKINDTSLKLEIGRDYLVLLRPNEESMKVIRSGASVAVWDALNVDEIIAVVESR